MQERSLSCSSRLGEKFSEPAGELTCRSSCPVQAQICLLLASACTGPRSSSKLLQQKSATRDSLQGASFGAEVASLLHRSTCSQLESSRGLAVGRKLPVCTYAGCMSWVGNGDGNETQTISTQRRLEAFNKRTAATEIPQKRDLPLKGLSDLANMLGFALPM